MKSALIAGSVAGLFAAALPLSAMAQTSVTLYGIADAAIGASDRGDAAGVNNGAAANVFSGVQSTSRFGIRGSEDLGGGLKALFVAEGGWNVDEGTGSAANGGLDFARRSVVGLGGSFGTVMLGRDYTPAYYAGAATDVFNYGLFGTAFTYQQSGGYTLRASNAIHYTSPSFGGLTIRAMAGSGERYEQPKSQGNIYGVSALYQANRITASAYYQELRQATVPASAGYDRNKQYGIGGGYDFGPARLLAGWGRSELSADSTDFDFYNVGAGVRIGAGELLASFTQLKAEAGRNGLLGGTAGAEGKAKVYGVAYTYPLSKRTNVYASFGTTRNDSNAAFGVFASGTSVGAAGAGAKPKAVALGIRHMF
ncbi:MAG: porin [Burkholderiaceae bacterium]